MELAGCASGRGWQEESSAFLGGFARDEVLRFRGNSGRSY